MTGKGTYFRVGIFVLVAMGLIVLGVIAFGVGLTANRATITAETYVDSSVQGLEAGSKVRNLGVEVGRVKRVTFIDVVYDVSSEFMLERGRWVLIRLSLFKDTLPSTMEENWDRAVAGGRLKPKTIHHVIIHHTRRLHMGITNGGPDKTKTSFL